MVHHLDQPLLDLIYKQKERAVSLLDHRPISYDDYREWCTTTTYVIAQAFGQSDENVKRFREASGCLSNQQSDDYQHGQWIRAGTRVLDSMTRQFAIGSSGSSSAQTPDRIFLVHGHDEIKHTVARFLEQLQLKPIILDEQPSKGMTIIEKFEENANVRFAIVLLTPDDLGYPVHSPQTPRARARQNVIFELGYFLGRLGRAKVCAIYKDDLEVPSDYSGVIFISWNDDWRMKLIRELIAARFSIDVNHFFSR
jgi:hypothetical protein